MPPREAPLHRIHVVSVSPLAATDSNLEVVSECAFEAAAEDECARELDEGVVELGSSLPAGAEAPLVVQPGVGAFDPPALTRERVTRAALPGAAFLGDPRLDAAFAQRSTDVFGVVAAVGEQPVGPAAAAAPQRRDRVDHRERMAAVVVVRGADPGGQRRAAAVAG